MSELPVRAHDNTSPAGAAANALALSLIVPTYNEAESLPALFARLDEVMAGAPERYGRSYEVVLVDDGSTDATFKLCAERQQQDAHVRVVRFRRNFGKTAALHAGFALSRGRYVVTLDADLQEDPADMFRLLEPLDAGYDMVSAWREQRNDPLAKTLPSRVFNAVVARVTGLALHDFNCGFKAYRREVITELRLYGELHRFIPVLAHQQGFRVVELPVRHQARRHGKSKFGAGRLGSGYLDFIQVIFLVLYLRRPFRLFGSLGSLLCAGGMAVLGYLTVLWFLGDRPIGDRPLLTLGMLMVLAGLQFLSTGLIGEMLRNLNYRPGDEYAIREILGQPQDAS
jgi:glycosyltransferase involved in cell wall biosynthesis